MAGRTSDRRAMELSDHLLDLTSRSSSLVRENLRRHGARPLASVLAALQAPEIEPLQGRDDLWEVIGDQVAEHYGPEIAREAIAELRADPVAPTSNHFGVDTVADSVQGTLLFALRGSNGARRARRTIVVLGFGSISLNNLSYPMGLVLYDPPHGLVDELPQRLPVFPNRVKRCSVSAAAPFNEQMVGHARARLRRLHGSGELSEFCEHAAGEILDEDFAEPSTVAQPSYGRQATRINARLWDRLFSGGSAPTRLVQLEIESICSELLRRDLYEPASLIHRLFFSTPVREHLLAALDGARACWQRALLRRRLDQPRGAVPGQGGTVFFWGLTDSGTRIPLTLDGSGAALSLTGADDRGRPWRYEFSADSLVAALAAGQLLPSLFTCFATLAFARGLGCIGGYFQVQYLPVIQRAVADALTADAACATTADLVLQVPTELCLAGLQPVVRVLDGGAAIPAGPVEISGAGGLTETDLDRIQEITVRDAYLAAFTDVLHHLVPVAALPAGWRGRLATENGERHLGVVRLEPGR